MRDLLLSLTWRDLRVRYKQSLLGIGWAVLLPVSMMLIFTFVFTRAIDGKAALKLDVPYALYAYVGLVPWTFLTASLSGCVNSLVANRNLVTKVYFPREAFPLSCVAASFVDFCIASVVLVVLAIYFESTSAWQFRFATPLLFVPVILIVQIALTVGAGMFLAMANLFYRDVRQVYGVAVQLLMFISAVVVPVPAGDSLMARVIWANPLVPIMTAYRDCVLHARWPAMGSFAYAGIFSSLVLIGGVVAFRRSSHRFAECI